MTNCGGPYDWKIVDYAIREFFYQKVQHKIKPLPLILYLKAQYKSHLYFRHQEKTHKLKGISLERHYLRMLRKHFAATNLKTYP